jgi:hypothetical protein
VNNIVVREGERGVFGTKRRMIVRRNRYGIGMDVGWLVVDRDGAVVEVWWGNTRDRVSLSSLIADGLDHEYNFDPPTDAEIDEAAGPATEQGGADAE